MLYHDGTSSRQCNTGFCTSFVKSRRYQNEWQNSGDLVEGFERNFTIDSDDAECVDFLALGEKCLFDVECGPTAYCDIHDTTTCLAFKAPGTTCAADLECGLYGSKWVCSGAPACACVAFLYWCTCDACAALRVAFVRAAARCGGLYRQVCLNSVCGEPGTEPETVSSAQRRTPLALALGSLLAAFAAVLATSNAAAAY